MITVLFWIIFGGLVGWIGALINENRDAKQTAAYIVLGIIGSLLGGALINLINGGETVRIGINTLLFPTLGAIIALFVVIQARKQS